MADFKPPKATCENYAGQPCNWLERLTFRGDSPLEQLRKREQNVKRLGLSPRNAIALAGDADGYAALWFGVGLVAGALATGLGCAFLCRNTKPKEA